MLIDNINKIIKVITQDKYIYVKVINNLREILENSRVQIRKSCNHITYHLIK